jgi:myosin heavy subunit
VCHFAGDVAYDVDGFVEKNKDSVSEVITECLGSSSHALLKSIYSEKVTALENAQNKSIRGNTLSA